MSQWSFARTCRVTECFPRKTSWCRNERAGHGWQSVRYNGLDTAQFKNIHLKKTYIYMEKIWKQTHIKMELRIMRAYYFQLPHMDAKRGL